jgi:hypothetical protein
MLKWDITEKIHSNKAKCIKFCFDSLDIFSCILYLLLVSYWIVGNSIVQGTYILVLSEYFAKLDDRCILRNEIVYTTFGSTSQEDHDVQIAVETRVKPPQILGHANYARSVRQPFPSKIGLRFSREVVIANVSPFQMLSSLCVIDTNFTILRHFLLKLWRNEILR